VKYSLSYWISCQYLVKDTDVKLALMLLLTVVQAHAAVTPRFACTLLDGSAHFSVTDLSAKFPASVSSCLPVLTESAAPERPPRIDLQHEVMMPKSTKSIKLVSSRKHGMMAKSHAMPLDLAAQIEAVGSRHQIDPKLIGALIYVESRYKSDAVSPKGAIGLMQIMPATAKRYGIDKASKLLDPAVNLDVGTRHLRDLRTTYGHRTDLVLAAYNAGEGAVTRYGHRIPPYPETLAYVAKIDSLLKSKNVTR
jgi:Transglycosylase SLT domain